MSAELDKIVDRCTKLDTAERYADILAVKAELVELYSNQGIGKLFTET